MDEVTIEVLWLEQTDDGYPIKDSVLVGDRLIGGVKHPNGVAFQVPLSAIRAAQKSKEDN